MPPDDPEKPTAVNITLDSPSPNPPNENAESIAEAREEIARIAGEVETLQTTINSGIESNREWTNQQLATLQQQLTDLTANYQTLAAGMPDQLKELREELTQLRQSIQKDPDETPIVPVVDPALVVVADTPPIVPASDAPLKDGSKSPSPQKRKNRVI